MIYNRSSLSRFKAESVLWGLALWRRKCIRLGRLYAVRNDHIAETKAREVAN